MNEEKENFIIISLISIFTCLGFILLSIIGFILVFVVIISDTSLFETILLLVPFVLIAYNISKLIKRTLVEGDKLIRSLPTYTKKRKEGL